jgi:hypothetical protein
MSAETGSIRLRRVDDVQEVRCLQQLSLGFPYGTDRHLAMRMRVLERPDHAGEEMRETFALGLGKL